MKADLACPGQDGVILGAAITLDLRGHKISGGSASFDAFGIGLLSGYNVKLLNGSVEHFGRGIEVVGRGVEAPSGSVAEVTNVSFASNDYGAQLTSIELLSFTSTRFVNNNRGISSILGGRGTVTKSVFRGNQLGALIDDSGLTVTQSIIDRNDAGISCYEAFCHLDGNSIRNNNTGVSTGFVGDYAMTKNVISGNIVGVDSGGPTGADIRYNTFVRNKTGLALSYNFGTIIAIPSSATTGSRPATILRPSLV